MDHIVLGAAPCDEPCASPGSRDYAARASAECDAYLEQLERRFGPAPFGSGYHVRRDTMSLGRPFQVVLYYNAADPVQLSYAWGVEAELPHEWDETARNAMLEAA